MTTAQLHKDAYLTSDAALVQNLGSDFFVVKGIEIGQEVVKAQLFEPQFEHVIDTITLTVAEAMSLEPPSPVLVTVGVLVKFKLKVFQQKVAQGTFSNGLSFVIF